MTLRAGALRVRLHPVLPVLWCFSVLTGDGQRFCAMVLALLWHECGHFAAAKGAGIAVSEMELTPFGGVMAVENERLASPGRRFLLAAGGPAFSFLGCFLAAWLYRKGALDFSFASAFVKCGFALLCVNLLPVLPLDGGRMLGALLVRFLPPARIDRALTGAAYLTGGLLCLMSLVFALQGQFTLAPAFAGLYLIYAAGLESRSRVSGYVTALIARRQRLEQREVLPVEIVAAGGDMPAGRLLSGLNPGKYHLILVLSRDGMGREGVIDEQALCDAVLDKSDAPLKKALKKSDPV